MAMTQDRQVAAGLQKAAGVCGADTDACDQARLECGTLLAATLKAQVGFDEGAWLRDLLMPYLGQSYPLSRQFSATPPANDTSCAGDPAALNAAAGRRLAQAAKRQSIFDEYPKFSTWVNSTYTKCREQANVDQQKALSTRSDGEKLAAAALAAKLAEEARQKADDDLRKKAELEAKIKHDAQRKAEEDARNQAKNEAAAKKANEAAADQAEREKNDHEKAIKQAENDRVVAEREGRLNQAKGQKSQMVTDAKTDLQRATDDANAKQKAAARAVDERSPAAALLAGEAATAEKARQAAEQRLADTKVKADRIEIDETSERSRGSLGAQVVIGYGALSNADGTAAGVLLGIQGAAHFGFWGTAPAEGLASGLEVRINAKFLGQVGGTGAQSGFDGRAAVRWFFGRIGLGAAAEYRLFNSTLVNAALAQSPRTFSAFGFGPSFGLAFIDTPNVRVMLNLSWMPIVANDLLRVIADLEVAYRFLVFGIAGGTQTDPVGPARVGFFLTGLAGVRLGW